MKTCSKCGESKPLEAYNKKHTAKDGLHSQCKACMKVYNDANKERKKAGAAAWREANKERNLANALAWYKANKERAQASRAVWTEVNKDRLAAQQAEWYKANRDRKRATSAKWYKANKERGKASAQAWREANKERAQASRAVWAKANPDKCVESAHRYRTRKADNGVNLVTAAETAAIAAMPCTACKAGGPSTVDHIIPIVRGGAHTIGNLMPLCKSCNASKRDMLYTEWKYSARPQALKAFAA